MKKSSSTHWAGMGVPAALLVVALVYGREALTIRAQFDEGLVGPSFLPLFLTGVVVTGLLAILFKQWRGSDAAEVGESGEDSGAVSGEGSGKVFESHRKPALVALSVLLYTAVFKLLGYLLATVLLAYVMLALFDYACARPLRRGGVAVVITAVFYILFMLCFSVRLQLLPGGLS